MVTWCHLLHCDCMCIIYIAQSGTHMAVVAERVINERLFQA